MTRHPGLDELRAGAERGPAAAGGAVARHLRACTACRESTQWIEAVKASARGLGAVPAPAGAWERIAARVSAGETVILPLAAAPLPRLPRLSPAVLARVAAVLLLVAGALSAAIPGGPVHRWLRRVWDRPATTTPPATRPLPAPPAPRVPEPVSEARLLVPAQAGAVAIVLDAPAAGVRIHVRLVDAGDVEVHATGAAAGARFLSGPGRLTIDGAGPGTVSVAVPRTVRHLSLRVDGRLLLERTRGELRVLAPGADTVGSEIVLTPESTGSPRP